MKKLWSSKWKSSTQTRKQRKYIHNAPLHIKHKLMSSHLSKKLREEFNIRSVPVRVGDKVLIKTGQFKGLTGDVVKVSLKRNFVHVKNATLKKNDGTESFYPIHPSNLEIVELNLNDQRRAEKLDKLKKLNTTKKEVKE